MSEFDGKVALVTGGAQGIGKAISEHLGAIGAAVCVNYRRSEIEAAHTVEVIEKAGGRALAVRADIGDEEQVAELFRTIRAELGPVDLLVNNAAWTRLLTHEELTFARWRRFMSSNLDGPFLTTWAAKKDMEAAGGGAVVNISSVGGIRARGDMIGYGSAKAGLNQLTKSSAIALAPLGIRVNAIAVGVVEGPRGQSLGEEVHAKYRSAIALGREGHPEEIAEVVGFLLSAKASFVTGEVVTVAGGPS